MNELCFVTLSNWASREGRKAVPYHLFWRHYFKLDPGLRFVARLFSQFALIVLVAQAAIMCRLHLMDSKGALGPLWRAFGVALADQAQSKIGGEAQRNLQQAEKLFARGRFDEANRLVMALIGTPSGLLGPELSRALLLKARLENAFGRDRQMLVWLEKLYAHDPMARLDPLLDPPHAFDHLRTLRKSGTLLSGQKAQPAVKSPLGTQGKVPAGQTPTAQIPAGQTPAGDGQNSELSEPSDESPSGLKAMEDALLKQDAYLRQESRFWVGLLPFGIGHFDAEQYSQGLLYLGGEVSVLLAATEMGQRETRAARQTLSDRSARVSNRDTANGSFIATFGFLGLWGHEVVDMVPELARRDPSKTEWLRYGLSFFPFGVGQLKNGDSSKALAIAGVESVLMTLSVLAPRDDHRGIATALFYVSLFYGAYDGWANHVWAPLVRPSVSHVPNHQRTSPTPEVSFYLMPTLLPSSQKNSGLRAGIEGQLKVLF